VHLVLHHDRAQLSGPLQTAERCMGLRGQHTPDRSCCLVGICSGLCGVDILHSFASPDEDVSALAYFRSNCSLGCPFWQVIALVLGLIREGASWAEGRSRGIAQVGRIFDAIG
jgi:hypothetical protein